MKINNPLRVMWQNHDVATEECRRGGSLSAAGVRIAAVRGLIRTAAMTPRGARLYETEDVEEYLAERARSRAEGVRR